MCNWNPVVSLFATLFGEKKWNKIFFFNFSRQNQTAALTAVLRQWWYLHWAPFEGCAACLLSRAEDGQVGWINASQLRDQRIESLLGLELLLVCVYVCVNKPKLKTCQKTHKKTTTTACVVSNGFNLPMQFFPPNNYQLAIHDPTQN